MTKGFVQRGCDEPVLSQGKGSNLNLREGELDAPVLRWSEDDGDSLT